MVNANKTRNIWWIEKPKGNIGTKRINGFKTEFLEFLSNSSMHCYGKLVEKDRNGWERLMWIIVHYLALSASAVALNKIWQDYNQKPLKTNLHGTLYPADLIPFPAVSICSNNRIEKSAAENYATYLSSLDPEHRNVSFFLKNIRNMGAFYDPEVTNLREIIEFQTFLNEYDTNVSEHFYHTRRRMKQMTPPCSKLLLKCIFAGNTVPCLSTEMFKMSVTHRGYCCLFNVNETESLISFDKGVIYEKNRKLAETGITVVLNATTEEYFYKMFDLNGFIIHVYDSSKYDDIASGAITESFVSRSSESFISISTQVVESDNEIRRYPTSTRGCLFEDEYPEKYGNRYSMNNCITNCRMKSIWRLCGCIPFYFRRSYIDANELVPQCNLNHITCLDHFKLKWLAVLTSRENLNGLEEDAENALFCPECLPSCNYIRYTVKTSSLPLTRHQVRDTHLKDGIKNFSQVSLVRIFFAQPTSWNFRQTVRSPWYQILSSVGGICGIVTGFSLAALGEFMIFIFDQTLHCLKSTSNTKKIHKALVIYP